MIPRPFELHSPTSISEAVALLRRLDDPKVLAGGQSLVPLMKLRLASPANLVDIGKIPGLSYVKEAKGRLLFGSMTTHDEVAESPLVAAKCMVLSEAAGLIGDRQVRNRGTIGGTVCHADPAADVPAVLLALDAKLKATGPRGKRTIKAKDFFKDLFTTDLRKGEILTEVEVPVLPPRTGGAYLKLHRGKGDLATVGLAAALTVGRSGKCEEARLGLAGVGLTALRPEKAEKVLEGKKLTEAVIAEACEEAAKAARPTSDIMGPAEYKREMVKVYTKRAIQVCLSRV